MQKSNPLILVVDDQVENRMIIKMALKKENYDFIEASDGEEALKMAIKHSPDVILMDAMMPNIDGFDATIAMRGISKFERTPILMITALNDKDDYIKALNCGVNDFVTKPIDKNELLTRCRSYVNMSTLNNKYVDATQNPVTNLPNANSLRDKLKEEDSSIIILIKIDGYKSLSEFYEAQTIASLELKFIELLKKHFPIPSLQYSLFNTSPGYFVIFMNAELLKTREEIEGACSDFYIQMRKNKIEFDTFEFDVLLTMGISAYENVSLEHATVALNEAKRIKKPFMFANTIIERSREQIKKNLEWVKKIKNGIDEDRFVPFFQPIYNNKEKRIDKFECLIRYIGEDGEIVSPYFFIDVAQKAKYYHHLTRIMIQKSMDTFKNREVDFSVNISGYDIEDTSTREFIYTILENNSDVAKRIVFELLEDESLEEAGTEEILRNFISKVKSLGAKIAIDDFGSGYSNFIRLMDYQPDILKLDGSLIKNITTENFSENIVSTMIDFSKRMSFETVAEFVSSADILEKVTNMDITYTQGYEISPPVPEEELDELILKYNK